MKLIINSCECPLPSRLSNINRLIKQETIKHKQQLSPLKVSIRSIGIVIIKTDGSLCIILHGKQPWKSKRARKTIDCIYTHDYCASKDIITL